MSAGLYLSPRPFQASSWSSLYRNTGVTIPVWTHHAIASRRRKLNHIFHPLSFREVTDISCQSGKRIFLSNMGKPTLHEDSLGDYLDLLPFAKYLVCFERWSCTGYINKKAELGEEMATASVAVIGYGVNLSAEPTGCQFRAIQIVSTELHWQGQAATKYCCIYVCVFIHFCSSI